MSRCKANRDINYITTYPEMRGQKELTFVAVCTFAKRFMYTGQLISLGVVHCGSSFAFFSPALYKYISGCSVSEIVIGNEEVGNEEAKAVLEKVNWFLINVLTESFFLFFNRS